MRLPTHLSEASSPAKVKAQQEQSQDSSGQDQDATATAVASLAVLLEATKEEFLLLRLAVFHLLVAAETERLLKWISELEQCYQHISFY